MSTDRDVTVIVRSWLEDGRTALPDRVLDAVLDQLPATPQRRAWWPAWRLEQMNTTMRLLTAVAAVLVVAVIGVLVLPRLGGAGTSPTTRTSPVPAASPIALMSGAPPGTDLPPGTYLVDRPFPIRATFTVPAGWTAYTVDSRTAGILVNHRKPPDGSGWGIFFLAGPHFYADPCRPGSGTLPAGDVSTAANVVAALQALPGVDATTEAISVDGRPATLVTLTAHPDTTTCLGNGATIWQTMDGSDYTISPGQVVQLRVIDVDGMPVVLMTSDFPESSHWENQAPGATPNPTAHVADQLELRAIVDSVRILGATTTSPPPPAAESPPPSASPASS